MNPSIFILCVHIFVKCHAAKILAVFTAPSISHQVVFRPYTQELAKRGHQLTVVTTDPAFPKNSAPENLVEIDIHEMLYTVLKSNYTDLKVAEKVTMQSRFDGIFGIISKIGETFYMSDVVSQLRRQQFDLLVLEAFHKMVLPLAHILQLPVIQISSFGSMFDYETVGAPCHPTLYPEVMTQRIQNLTNVEKVYETFLNVMVKNNMLMHEKKFEDIVNKLNANVPSLDILLNRVSKLLLNVQPIWEENRPVPLGVSYINGIHRWPKQPLSPELKNFLDTSKHGVIYMSLGTNVHPSLLPKDKIKIILNTLSKLPQDVLLKWDQDELPDKPINVKVGKWFPQSAILEHPKVKVFITQCGLQSTEEAIDAGMPLIGIPFLFDQWTNAEKYVRHNIGLKLDIETLTEENFREAIVTVITDKSYRENMIRFRTLMRDQPHSALDTAVWWTEYVIRYSGAAHLRSPAANMPWTQYYELDLLLIVVTIAIVALSVVFILLCCILKRIVSVLRRKLKIK